MTNLDRQSLGAESLDSAATGRATVGQDPSGFKPQPLKRPYRVELNFCVAAETLGSVEGTEAIIVDFIERETGLPVEGGSIELMLDSDVIADSPLAKELAR